MQDKKVIALIVLGVLAVISLIYGVTATPKSKYRSAPSVQAQAAPAQSSTIVSVAATGRRARRSRFDVWKRDPFVTGIAAPTASSALTLNGIIWNSTNPKAMIGDAIVAKGDKIGVNKVVDIKPDKVILNDGTKEFELKMEK